jgi:hypothetical protein
VAAIQRRTFTPIDMIIIITRKPEICVKLYIKCAVILVVVMNPCLEDIVSCQFNAKHLKVLEEFLFQSSINNSI